MAKEYGFFANSGGDRRYGADDFTQYFRDICTDGVLGNSVGNLQVTAGTGLKVSVGTGTAYVDGHFYRPTVAKTLTLAAADGAYARYDRVVVRCDYANRLVKVCVLTGVPAASPAAPSIVRDDEYYDISLAKVQISANATSLSQSDITDTRFDATVCGVVTGAIDTIDTTNLFAQYDGEWDLLKYACEQDAPAVIAAWDSLNVTKSVSGVYPVNGNIPLTLANIGETSTYKRDILRYKVQCGRVTTDASGTATVTFASGSFPAVPFIVAQGAGTETGQYASVKYDISVYNRTYTGFSVRSWSGSNGVSAIVDWIAIY